MLAGVAGSTAFGDKAHQRVAASEHERRRRSIEQRGLSVPVCARRGVVAGQDRRDAAWGSVRPHGGCVDGRRPGCLDGAASFHPTARVTSSIPSFGTRSPLGWSSTSGRCCSFRCLRRGVSAAAWRRRRRGAAQPHRPCGLRPRLHRVGGPDRARHRHPRRPGQWASCCRAGDRRKAGRGITGSSLIRAFELIGGFAW